MMQKEITQADLNFDGPTIEPAMDRERLMGQLAHVLALMIDGKWRTLSEIAGDRYSQAGVSARLRDLRKLRFGAYTVDRRRCGPLKSGLFEYRVSRDAALPEGARLKSADTTASHLGF